MRKRLMPAVLLPLFLLLFACDTDQESLSIGTDPQITGGRIRARWNILSDVAVSVEVTVKDPQGASDIRQVTLRVTDEMNTPVYQDSLYDDGSVHYPEAGDVFAGDGVFRNRIKPSNITGTEGIYRFVLQASDRDGNTSAAWEQDVLFGFNQAPAVVAVSGPDSLPSGSPGIILSAVVSDPNGTDEIEEVVFDVYKGAEKVTPVPVPLSNDGDFGKNGDLFAGDSVYSVRLDSTFAAGRLGWYTLRFTAYDEFNDPGQELEKQLFLENKTGRIHSVSAPEKVAKPRKAFNPGDSTSYTRILVTARVSDPQGLADIDSVYFYSLKPNGQFANNGAPFLLRDNGLPFNINNLLIEAGDRIKDDGIYSFSVVLINSPDTLLGEYVWSFYMRDKAGNRTDVTSINIEVF